MHVGNHYKLKEFIYWTRRDIYRLIILATIPTFLFQVFSLGWIAIPWVPVALVGTAQLLLPALKIPKPITVFGKPGKYGAP